jgi:hypothetical protein
MSINVAGITFSRPEPLVNSVLPEGPGLYVLLVARGIGASRSYEPIGCGQVESLANCLRLRDACVQDAARTHPCELLFVAVHPFEEDWTPGERLLLEMRMRRAIDPPITVPAFRRREVPTRIAAAYR